MSQDHPNPATRPAACALEQGTLSVRNALSSQRKYGISPPRLQVEARKRDLAMFNLAIDSKLRGCDLAGLKIDDLCISGRLRDRATIIQRKTGRAIQFELTEQTHASIEDWLAILKIREGRFLFPSRVHAEPHISTRQYARIVHGWVEAPGWTTRCLARIRCGERKPPRYIKRQET